MPIMAVANYLRFIGCGYSVYSVQAVRLTRITTVQIGWKSFSDKHGTTLAAREVSDVPGLSSACVTPSSGEVGPGALKTGDYKNPEYFSYHSTSYFEAEIEMARYRLPQPSNKKTK